MLETFSWLSDYQRMWPFSCSRGPLESCLAFLLLLSSEKTISDKLSSDLVTVGSTINYICFEIRLDDEQEACRLGKSSHTFCTITQNGDFTPCLLGDPSQIVKKDYFVTW